MLSISSHDETRCSPTQDGLNAVDVAGSVGPRQYMHTQELREYIISDLSASGVSVRKPRVLLAFAVHTLLILSLQFMSVSPADGKTQVLNWHC